MSSTPPTWNPFPRQPSSINTPEAFRTALKLTCNAFPCDDTVFHFAVTPKASHHPHLDPNSNSNPYAKGIKLDIAPEKYNACYVAGSAAVSHVLDIVLCRTLKNLGGPLPSLETRYQWKPNDSDLFFLGNSAAHRFQMGVTDFVFVKDKTVEELLLNFDLPCCRAAVNAAGDIWVSAQCLNAIYTGSYNLPAFLRDKGKFERQTRPCVGGESALFNRFHDRIKKYADRGFTVNWVDSNAVPSWVTKRFNYALPTIPAVTVKTPVTSTSSSLLDLMSVPMPRMRV